MTLAATRVMLRAWEKGLPGLAQGTASSMRQSSASGSPSGSSTPTPPATRRPWRADYGVFANGRYQLSANLRELLDHVRFLESKREE